MANYNASLRYKGTNGKMRGFGVWVMEYEQGHTLAGEEAQSRWYKHFYPKSYSPGVMTIKGRVPTQHRYDQLATFIRDHQEALIRAPGASNIAGQSQLPLLKFSLPSENIYVDGWVNTFEAGAKRFNTAPEYTLDFVVIRDNHSATLDLRPAYTVRAWFTGATVEQGTIDNKVTADLGYEMHIDDDGEGGRGGV